GCAIQRRREILSALDEDVRIRGRDMNGPLATRRRRGRFRILRAACDQSDGEREYEGGGAPHGAPVCRAATLRSLRARSARAAKSAGAMKPTTRVFGTSTPSGVRKSTVGTPFTPKRVRSA